MISKGTHKYRRIHGFALLMLAFLAPSAHAVPPSHEAREIRDRENSRWSLTTLYERSFLNGSREDWDAINVEMLGRPIDELIIGVTIDPRHREDATDVLYGASIAYLPLDVLELHWGATFTPNADFSAKQIYNFGIDYRASSLVSLLFELERLNYSAGPVNQYTQGLTFWFTDDDRTYLSLEYIYGKAFHDRYFDAAKARMTIGLPRNHSLRFGIYHGKQPEDDPAVPGTLLLTADSYSAFYHFPLGDHVEMIVGLEHEELRNTYDRTAATIGVTTRFF